MSHIRLTRSGKWEVFGVFLFVDAFKCQRLRVYVTLNF